MDVHVEAVVDGERFTLKLQDVVEGYEARAIEVPDDWIDKVVIEASAPWSSGSWSSNGWAGGGSAKGDEPAYLDEEGR